MNISTDRSIAVLPFVNMSKDAEDEYFSDGMTEEIINALTRVEGLRVIARTSSFAFKGKNLDIRAIGKQLGVTSILEGSVRRSQKRLRITAQLINASDGMHIWSQNFDREWEDIFALQDEVSLLIAEKLRENFGHFELKEQLIEAPTQNIEAYNLYLKARYHHLKWDGQGIRTAIALYQQCIDAEPSFPLPYFGIGYCFAMAGSWGSSPDLLERAQQFLEQGFQLDDQSALGYFGKATLAFWGHWDFAQGQAHFLKAIELNPSYTEAKEGLAELYSAVGLFTEASEMVDSILSINPLSPNHFFTQANIHYLKGEFVKALAFLEAALQIDAKFAHAIALKQLCLLHLNRRDHLEVYLKVEPAVEQPAACRALLELLYPGAYPDIDPISVTAELERQPSETLFPWLLFLKTQLKEVEAALDLLAAGIQTHTGQIINFKHTPLLHPLHTDLRFQRLVDTVFSAPLTAPQPADSTQANSPKRILLSDREVAQILPALKQLIEEQEIYLDASLSLRALAERLDINANKLSWLLNEHLGQKFNEYINHFRLAAFKKFALDPKNHHLTLLAIAYDSGFNSKTVFNAFFKKREGMTPSAWVKRNR